MAHRTSKGSTIRNDPFGSVIPLPGQVDNDPPENLERRQESKGASAPIRRQKLTIHLDEPLANRIKNAAYWNPRLTIAKIAEQGLRWAIEEVEKENDGPYPHRESELIGGRPIK